jgi:hypothetical protein
MKCKICNNDFEYSKTNFSTHKKTKKHLKLLNTKKMKDDLMNDTDEIIKENIDINKDNYESIIEKVNNINCIIREILLILNK